ncbi:MAG: PLP-dependent aminotransferase family protein [Planctomycetota bacterium]
MILLNIKTKGRAPIFRQVFTQIRDLIDRGTLKPGDRLPSSRLLAGKLGVHRTTVFKAYQELWALGYVESRPGSYSVVRERHKVCTLEQRAEKGAVAWDEATAPAAKKVLQLSANMRKHWPEVTPQGLIDLGSLHPDPRLFPVDAFRKQMNRVLVNHGAEMLSYGPSEGHPPLREYIAQRLRIHGISIAWDEILITNGAQNGLDLIMKLMAAPGCRVFVESPTYALVLPILAYYDAEVVGIPMEKTGISLRRLEAEFQKGKPSFLYTMPNFQNPTGITMTQAHREALLSLCEMHGVPLIEDAFEEEMKYFGKVPLPIKSMDRRQVVVYLGSFSKVLFPGIRIGWIAAERECIQRLAALKRFSDLSSASPMQAALAEFCRQGGYEAHIKRMHRIYRKRMQCALDALEAHVKQKKARWIEPQGGFLIWLSLEGLNQSQGEVYEGLTRKGIRVTLGNPFFPGKSSRKYLRISISSLDEKEIVEGIRRLGEGIDRLYRG